MGPRDPICRHMSKVARNASAFAGKDPVVRLTPKGADLLISWVELSGRSAWRHVLLGPIRGGLSAATYKPADHHPRQDPNL
jgi:hypothetical protein